jgi:hypothetical protein
MKLTLNWLKRHNACEEAVEAFQSQSETDVIKILKKLIIINIDWADWLIVRKMNKRQKIMYAVYAAEQVIHMYEQKYPDDTRPRKAIEAAKKYLKRPSEKNKHAAADAAYAAAYAADAAADAAAYMRRLMRLMRRLMRLMRLMRRLMRLMRRLMRLN